MNYKVALVLLFSLVLQTVSYQMPHYIILCPASCTCSYVSGIPTSADCSGRRLISVPPELPRRLKHLSLSKNKISHLKCHDFNYMTNLMTLDLSHNTLQTLAGTLTRKESKYKCCNAKSLPVGKNHFLIGRLNDAFSGGKAVRGTCKTPLNPLTQLQRLLLCDNQISHLEAYTFSGLSNLLYLDLSNNRLTTLDPQSFRGLQSLRNLNLYGNRPSLFPDDLFQDQIELEELNIGYGSGDPLYLVLNPNASQCYPDQALSRLENLKILRMRGLSSPCVPGPGFRKLENLSVLDFNTGGCEVDSLPEYFFSNISSKTNFSLTTILLQSCKITFIHNQTFSNMPSLSHVDLSGNSELQCRNTFSATVSFPETRIKEFDMNNVNSIRYLRLTPATFKYIRNTSLEILKMANNQILIIDNEVAFALPKTLKVLDLSDNKLLSADLLFSLPVLINLEILDMSRQIQNKVSIDIDVPRSNIVEESNSDVCHMLRDDSFNSRTTSIGTRTTINNNHIGVSYPCSTENDKRCKAVTKLLISQISEKNTRTTNRQFSFAQWNLLVKSICPTYRPAIPTPKLGHTAMTLTETTIHRMINTLSNTSLLPWSGLNDKDSLSQSITIPRNLRQIYASQLKLGYAVPAISFIINKFLWHIDVSRDMLWCFDGPVFGLNALKIVDLSNNFAVAISPYFFKGVRNITHLFLSSNNYAASFELDVECATFSPLEELKVLDMANNGLQILHSNVFARNKKLRFLNLTRNSLQDIPRLSQLKELKYLNVSFNVIKAFSKRTMSDLDKIAISSNFTVDLRGNPLTCDCSSLGFLEWLGKTNIKLVGRNNYTCTYINCTVLSLNQSEMIISDLWRICQGESTFLTSMVLFCVTIVVYLALALTSYYRYRLLFYVYLNKQRFFSHVYEPEHQRHNDVFLLYDDQDPIWRQNVLQVVIPNLTRQGLTYHVSEVGLDDPSAGRSIREVVEESVLGGNKTLVLLTAEIFPDDERQLEVGMAKIVEQMLGRRRLLFLVAEKINPKTLPNNIYRLLTVSRLIPYFPESDQFWANLAKEIKL